MHELSVAQHLIELACEAAEREQAARVCKLTVKIGALAAIVKESLQFSFELVAEGTLCAGAELEIIELPLVVRCTACDADQTLTDVLNFACPACYAPCSEIVSGQELDLVSMEIDDREIDEYAAADC